MGRTLGGAWGCAGHALLFGARDVEKARSAAAYAGPNARCGSNREAAEHGEVILWNPRVADAAQVLDETSLLDGKIVIDMNNGLMPKDFRVQPKADSFAARLAASLPRARVVKGFNTLAQEVFDHQAEVIRGHNVSVFIAGDDADAKATTASLAAQLGFVPVDVGALERATYLEQLGDFIRYMMGGMNHGPFATISLEKLPQTAASRFGGRQPSHLY
jgi:predicted dinucleotide-binding enzyme